MRVQATDTALQALEFSEPRSPAQAGPTRATEPLTAPGRADAPERATVDEAGFAELLRGALAKVNAAQHGADLAIERVATGDAEDLHEAIIALEQADIALRLTARVTQRAIEAYNEVSRMQV